MQCIYNNDNGRKVNEDNGYKENYYAYYGICFIGDPDFSGRSNESESFRKIADKVENGYFTSAMKRTEGMTITISAYAPEQGKVFDRWEQVFDKGDYSKVITLSDMYSSVTTFIYPKRGLKEAIHFRALYEDIVQSAGEQGCCDHDYEWEVEKEPTETEEGEADLKCTKCGNVKERQPISAYAYYIMTSTNKIKKAPAGSEVTITSKIWNSFPRSFFEERAVRRDITVKIQFPYDHKDYEMMILPTQIIDTSDKQIDYYGPQSLITIYNAAEVESK